MAVTSFVRCPTPQKCGVSSHLAGSDAAIACASGPTTARPNNAPTAVPSSVRPEDPGAAQKSNGAEKAVTSAVTYSMIKSEYSGGSGLEVAARLYQNEMVRHPDVDTEEDAMADLVDAVESNQGAAATAQFLVESGWQVDTSKANTPQIRQRVERGLLGDDAALDAIYDADIFSEGADYSAIQRHAERIEGHTLPAGMAQEIVENLVAEDQFFVERRGKTYTSGTNRQVGPYLKREANILAHALSEYTTGFDATSSVREDGQPDVTLLSHPGVRLVVNDPRDGLNPESGRNMEWCIEKEGRRQSLGTNVDSAHIDTVRSLEATLAAWQE